MFKYLMSHKRLVFYDFLIIAIVSCLFLLFDLGNIRFSVVDYIVHAVVVCVFFFLFRIIFRIYKQIWRFSGPQSYISLIFSDLLACLFASIMCRILPITHITVFKITSIIAVASLLTIFMRMVYQYVYKAEVKSKALAKTLNILLKIFAPGRFKVRTPGSINKTRIAIVGAGKLGVSLANELLNNPEAGYDPVMFIDTDVAKQGKQIEGLTVYSPNTDALTYIKFFEVKEIVFAISKVSEEHREHLFRFYRKTNCKLKMYDTPLLYASDKKQIRPINVEDLMPRSTVILDNNKIGYYFEGKVVFITGGGGSIGSEMARQIAYLNPSKLVLIDISENGVYDLQQELIMIHKEKLNLFVEIASVVDKNAIDAIFEYYKPDIVIHAAAHKHVPLMEHNCVEAIKNNIFGTKNVIDLCEKYNVQKFMLVSTDKAVNPTNIMGATKRFCEMMVQCTSLTGNTSYGATRFGNVLGSAGSVVPLFRRQIANGGPITITDKRIVRYFMTIPEACNLVLNATAMTEKGELFVLDMGKPVKIIDLAKNMIALSGAKNIEIIETGLRPGEKLFEEILVDNKHFTQTENKLIYVEKEKFNLEPQVIDDYLKKLNEACESNNEESAVKTLKEAVPTYVEPDVVNDTVIIKSM